MQKSTISSQSDFEHVMSQAGHHAREAIHELPNWISVLHQHFPRHPWIHFLHQWENVVFSMTVALVIAFIAIRAARKKDLIPAGLQNFCETVVEFFESFVTGILGESGRKHIPYLGTTFLYVLLMNWSGLVPMMKSATAAWSTTLALALATMVYVQVTGVREQGIRHYLIHLAGNPKGLLGLLLIPLTLALNLILEFGAVPFSLSLRLFANISSEDRLLLNFAQLALSSKFLAFPFQIFANCLAIILSLVQAFVFMLLSTVYLALVIPHEEHEQGEYQQAHAPAH